MKLDPSELNRQFWTDGYVVVEGLFDDSLLDLLHAKILDHFSGAFQNANSKDFDDLAATQVVPWFPELEGVDGFSLIDENPQMAEMTTAMLGEGWNTQVCMVMYSAPGSAGQAWHQDCPPEASQDYNLNRLVYTSDIDEQTGGQLVIVPGTHRQGTIPAGEPHGDLPGQVTIAPRKGSLVLLHGHCWHRVLPVGSTSRVSTNYRATPTGTPGNVTDVCVYRNMRFQFSTQSVVEHRTPG